jgi:hypothetical protein
MMTDRSSTPSVSCGIVLKLTTISSRGMLLTPIARVLDCSDRADDFLIVTVKGLGGGNSGLEIQIGGSDLEKFCTETLVLPREQAL